MKRHLSILTVFFTLTVAHTSTSAQGVWTQKANFPGASRVDAFYFSLSTKGYVGAGYDLASFYNDFWEYDATNNTWVQKQNFAGTNRWQTVSFNIGSKGYIGTGSNNNDLWEYDPVSDSWTQKASLPAIGRSAAIGFAIGNKGYIGAGYNSIPGYDDFWEYNPSSNSWSQKANIPGGNRTFAFGMSIGADGYIGTGNNAAGNTFNDFWKYDTTSNTWVQKTNFPGGQRKDIDGAHFIIGNYGYVGTGINQSTYYNDFWKYDPANDTWLQIPNLTGSARIGAIGFSLNNKGYIGLGLDGSNSCLNDLWEYSDTLLHSAINQIKLNNFISIYPNPFSTQTTFQTDKFIKNGSVTVYNSFGQTVKQMDNLTGQTIIFHRDNLPSGLYFVRLTLDGKTFSVDKLVITDK